MARFPALTTFDRLAVQRQELLVRQTARQFVDEQVLPLIKTASTKGDSEAVDPGNRRLGFLAPIRRLCCAGMSNVEYGLLMQGVGTLSGLRSSARYKLARYVPDSDVRIGEQKVALVAETPVGEAIGCFGLTDRCSDRSRRNANTRRPDGSTGS